MARSPSTGILPRSSWLPDARGTFGDWKAVGDGVCELRVHVGAGYRVFFGRDGNSVVILLDGGMKRSQNADIRQAKRSWRDYEARKKPAGWRTT